MNERQKLRFLGEMRVTANVTFACAAANTTRARALKERDDDPLFERDWREAIQTAHAAAQMRANDYPGPATS